MYSALRTFNRIQSDGVIETHTIGGAITATYNFNAFPTEDIAAFIFCRRERGLPEPQIVPLPHITIHNRRRRSIHFHRFRNKRALTQPDTQGSFWKLTFPEPICGPLALGFGCHYGLGMFRAVNTQ